MQSICIKFAGIDEISGALLLQFAAPENNATIDQSTIYSFHPWQYAAENIEQLLPYMANFGYEVLLAQQQAHPPEHQFTTQQFEQYSKLIGTQRSIEIDVAAVPIKTGSDNQYNPDSLANPNSQVDQIRCIVLEILAEEGLIPGRVE